MANPTRGENGIAPFLRVGPPPDRTRVEGWRQWQERRSAFIPAPRLTLEEYAAMSPRRRALHDLHRTATHVNMGLLETPMSAKVTKLMRGRMRNNALNFEPGTRDGLMVSGGGYLGKTETACDAAATFEMLWRDLHQQLLPGPVPGTRDLFVPVAYCRTPVRATPKGLCAAILDFYGAPLPKTLNGMIRAVRDSLRDHHTAALLLDDITRLRLHREDDQDTLDLVRELMDLNVTLVLIGVDIPRSGLLRSGYPAPRTGKWSFPPVKPGKSYNPSAATQTERRFDFVDLDPFDYETAEGMTAFIQHLAGIEDRLRLFRARPGMLTEGGMPEYLFGRTRGIVGLLRRRFFWRFSGRAVPDTAVVLLTWIAEVSAEPLVLEPEDRRVEWETNTWSLSTGGEDRSSLSVAAMVAAFEQTAAAIRERIRDLGFPGVATFYVWHDEQAGQLRCSTGSVSPDALPFSCTYVVSDDLGPVVEGFLADSELGSIAWSDLDDVQSISVKTGTEQEIMPLGVWVASVGASC